MQDCQECYKIKCRGCGWEPSPEEVVLIQKQIMTVCPDCGWCPSS